MLPSPAIGLPATTLLVEVQVAPLLADIHDEFAPLLRLSGICAAPSGGSNSASGSNGTSSGFCGNNSGCPSGEEDDMRGRRSPAASPVKTAESKLAELMAPVTVNLPPPMSSEDATSIKRYVEHFRQREGYERNYIALVFKEYKRRKGIDKKYDEGFASMSGELKRLREIELSPEVRAALSVVESRETAARTALQDAYDKFLGWVEKTTPLWIEEAQRHERQRVDNEKAKMAAIAAAREALTQELMLGKQLGNASDDKSLQKDGVIPGRNEEGILSYEPTVSVDSQMQASRDTVEVLSPTQLRRKAIRMLEAEEAEMKRRREEQLRLLRVQEEQLRAEIALKAQHEQEEAERRERAVGKVREDELARRYDALLEEEFTLQTRMRERREAEVRQEAERRAKLARIAEEEEQLQHRILEREACRKASEEEIWRAARETMMREVRAQEELLRQRITERTITMKAERDLREAEARIRAEAEAVRAEQEEALRQAKIQKEKKEKEQQLAFLREQEEAYKRRIREKELAEIDEKRRAAELLQQQHSTAATPAWTGHSLRLASTTPLVTPPGASFPGPYTVPPQASLSVYAPAVASNSYQPMVVAPLTAAMAPGVYQPYPSTVISSAWTGAVHPPSHPEQSNPTFAQSPSAPVIQTYFQPHVSGSAGVHVGLPQNSSSPGATVQVSPYAPTVMYTR